MAKKAKKAKKSKQIKKKSSSQEQPFMGKQGSQNKYFEVQQKQKSNQIAMRRFQ